MKIGLISGHGAGDCGAVGCGYQEADLTVELVKMLDERLKAMGIETVIYPYERNAYKDCKNSGLAVDFRGCKYVLEVHFNACVNDSSGNNFVTGSEIWVTPREVGVAVEERILRNLEVLGFTNRGVKKTDFLVINRVKDLGISSALIETCFIDDLDDMRLYQSKKAAVADAIVRGIADGFGYEVVTQSEEKSVERTEAEFVDYIGKLATEDMKKTGILASITAAQAILESGYGSSELAVNAHNLFGMKASLSGNTWASEWDGGIYTKETQEQNTDGSYETIKADFRAYENEAQSIKDHSDYLSGAKNGNSLRYESLVGCTDYKEAAQIVKNGGYATSLTYVDKLCSIIERWDLTQYDVVEQSEDKIENNTPNVSTYTVAKGDTMYGIASKFKMTPQELISLNPQIKDPAIINVGDIIYLSKTEEKEDVSNGISKYEAELYVGCCYVEYLNRLPDPSGLATYVDYLLSGGSKIEVDRALLNSDEYNQTHAFNNNFKRNYVIQCYDLLLGRFPESEEVIQNWMNDTNSLIEIYAGIYESEEAKRYRKDK